MSESAQRATPLLSLAMIVKNEARTLERILGNARVFCDELVVVDTGSSDQTVEIAKKMGAKVFEFTWINDFAAARNFSFAQCTGEWIIWLDADDVVPLASQKAFLALRNTVLPTIPADVILTPYHYGYTETGEVSVILERERIVRRGAGLSWSDPVHESLSGPGGQARKWPDGIIEHRPVGRKGSNARNLQIYEGWLDVATAAPRHLFLYANELLVAHRPAEAAQVLERYLARKDAATDPSELYVATLKLGDCLAQQNQHEAALGMYMQAAQLNPTRAEAYTSAGMACMALQRYTQAWPFMLMALAQPLPMASAYLAFKAYYREIPKKQLMVCWGHLTDAASQRQVADFASVMSEALVWVGFKQ